MGRSIALQELETVVFQGLVVTGSLFLNIAGVKQEGFFGGFFFLIESKASLKGMLAPRKLMFLP